MKRTDKLPGWRIKMNSSLRADWGCLAAIKNPAPQYEAELFFGQLDSFPRLDRFDSPI